MKKNSESYIVRVQIADKQFKNLHFSDYESASTEYHRNPAACVFRFKDCAGQWHVFGYKQPDLGV